MSRQPQLTKDKTTIDITQIELKGHQTGNITDKNCIFSQRLNENRTTNKK
jgi:hypothetical protein